MNHEHKDIPLVSVPYGAESCAHRCRETGVEYEFGRPPGHYVDESNAVFFVEESLIRTECPGCGRALRFHWESKETTRTKEEAKASAEWDGYGVIEEPWTSKDDEALVDYARSWGVEPAPPAPISIEYTVDPPASGFGTSVRELYEEVREKMAEAARLPEHVLFGYDPWAGIKSWTATRVIIDDPMGRPGLSPWSKKESDEEGPAGVRPNDTHVECDGCDGKGRAAAPPRWVSETCAKCSGSGLIPASRLGDAGGDEEPSSSRSILHAPPEIPPGTKRVAVYVDGTHVATVSGDVVGRPGREVIEEALDWDRKYDSGTYKVYSNEPPIKNRGTYTIRISKG